MSGAASVFVQDVDFTFWLIFTISAICLVGITGFMVFSIFRYSKKKHPEPSNIEGHTGLEIVWTIIPTILVMFIFIRNAGLSQNERRSTRRDGSESGRRDVVVEIHLPKRS